MHIPKRNNKTKLIQSKEFLFWGLDFLSKVWYNIIKEKGWY
jgi:hypothetical protein